MRETQTQACILFCPVLASKSQYGTSVFPKHSISFLNARVTKHKQKRPSQCTECARAKGESNRRAQGRACQVPQNDQTRQATNIDALRHQSKTAGPKAGRFSERRSGSETIFRGERSSPKARPPPAARERGKTSREPRLRARA